MLESEFFEYLGSGLKVPTEINGFLLSIESIDASLSLPEIKSIKLNKGASKI